MPANAGSSRVVSFVLPCDGQSKSITFNATGFPPSSAQFVLGGGVSLYKIDGSLQYIVLTTNAAGNTILGMGVNESSARIALPTFYQTPADASGNIPLSILGSCAPGTGASSGQILGFAILILTDFTASS
jgi:hypothetical protein